VAVFPPDVAVRELASVLPVGASLTPSAKWHVTLLFLGEVQSVSTVAASLDAVPVTGSFSLRLVGGGRFGSAAWAGVSGDLSGLRVLRDGVQTALREFVSESRPFRPHLTVSYRGDQAVQRALDGFTGSEWMVDEFALVRSQDGEYTPLRTWPLRP
jgi:RNA 2',3'-cyclic 3'-phosphodiesterase